MGRKIQINVESIIDGMKIKYFYESITTTQHAVLIIITITIKT